MWIFLALGSAFFAALTALLAKIGTQNVPSNLATMLRTGFVLLGALLLVSLSGDLGKWREISPRTWGFLALSGVATLFSWLCYFRALQIGPLAGVAALDKLSLPLTVALAALVLGEHFTLKTAFSLSLIGAGTFLLIQK